MEPTGVEDMSKMTDLNEDSILNNLKQRYESDYIYTYVSSILVAVNPYKYINGLYSQEIMHEYNKKLLGSLSPHIYAIANDCYYSMWKSQKNQCILVSGESGAGKTESTKLIIGCLSEISQSSRILTSKTTNRIEEAILQSSPILEAFGNAKTIYNNNSSRFGKFLQLYFDHYGKICGGTFHSYLLEKNRVVGQNPSERNYHIFYSLLSGTTDNLKDKYHLKSLENYKYLNNSDCIFDDTIDDTNTYHNVMKAMKVMQLDDEQIDNCLQLLSAVLHIGNIFFINAGGAQVSDKSVLGVVANLLSLDMNSLNDALTQRTFFLRGEEISTPLDIEHAMDAKDSLSMALYSRCFNYIIEKINQVIENSSDIFSSIGILDIFGFESFKINRFEQFNINYANEKLQEYFNKHIFSLEQYEYNVEGVTWKEIDWVDNGECLDLIESRLGILSLVDEESKFPKGTDQTMLLKLHRSHSNNPFYLKPRIENNQFGVKHYAGHVYYETYGYLEKNRDTFRADILSVLLNSRSDFIYDLFEMHRSTQDTINIKTAKKRPTVSSQFKDSLHSLMTTLNSCNPYFVRCIKPNSEKAADKFDSKLVLNQLQYSGMLETVKIRKLGYPIRMLYEHFYQRYKILPINLQTKDIDIKNVSATIISTYAMEKKDWELGNTKIFLKQNIENQLEMKRQKILISSATYIVAHFKGFLARKRYLECYRKIIKLQAHVKGFLYRSHYIKIYQAIVTLQCYTRGWAARTILKKLRIEFEEKKRQLEEEALKLEEEKKKEMERLIEEKKLQELEELKKKLKEEEVLREIEKEAARLLKEEQRQADFARAKELDENRKEAKIQAEKERKEREEIEKENEKQEQEHRLLIVEKKENEMQQLAELEEVDKMLTLDSNLRAAEQQVLQDFDESLALHFEEKDVNEDEDDIRGENSPYYEGYLFLKGGMMNMWKKRWFVLKDDTLMWFKSKQEAIKSGWLLKKGGGTGTLSRRNWKKRWFVLKNTILSYYDSDSENARLLGQIDVRAAKTIIDCSWEKENAIDIETYKRVFHLVAENSSECSEWYEALSHIHSCKFNELNRLEEEEANIKNAVGSLDVALIDNIVQVTDPTRPYTFTITTTERIYVLTSDTEKLMNCWKEALSPQYGEKGYSKEDVIYSGWLSKENNVLTARSGISALLKKCYFVLTSKTFDIYKSVDSCQKTGSLVLNSLCSVIAPDEKDFKEFDLWKFTVNGRKHSYNLYTLSYEEASRWTNLLQEVIDKKPSIKTKTQQLIVIIQEAHAKRNLKKIDLIYKVNPILRNSRHSIKSPLLPMPYGQIEKQTADGENVQTNLENEAIRIFNILLSSENFGDPVPLIQDIIQTCFDLNALRDEVYCQLIKQTSGVSDPDSLNNLRNWQILVCMCCTFLPSRRVLKFLQFHLKRQSEMHLTSQMSKYAEFCCDVVKRTRGRSFVPSREEIIACLSRREMKATVFCHGGGSCQISFTTATTANEVIGILINGMNLLNSQNIFALFEKCENEEKVIDGKTIIADVLSKFERESEKDRTKKWKLFFKLYCLLNTDQILFGDTIEYGFIYEQAHETVIKGHFPASDDTLLELAALRLQYIKGNYAPGEWIDNISSIYCLERIKPALSNKFVEEEPNFKKENTLMGTLRGLGKGTLRRKLQRTASDDSLLVDEVFKEDLSAITSSILEKWKKLKGMTSDEAVKAYLKIVQQWNGYGSTLYEVECRDGSYPNRLWLGISSKALSIYKHGDPYPLDEFSYESVLSFGTPAPTQYKVVVKGRNFIFHTPQVLEISKLMKAYIGEMMKTL